MITKPGSRGGASWTENGVTGSAISLDGGEQRVNVANSSDINLGNHQQRTISLWFKVDNRVTGDQKQVIYEEGGSTRGLNAYIDQNKLYVGGWNEPAVESDWDGTWLVADSLVVDQWHHLGLVLDGDETKFADALTAYLDGQSLGSGVGSQLWSHAGGIGIGGINGSTTFHDGTVSESGSGLVGEIDEVNLFNSALSTEQIQLLAV
ncbi:MAG: LamG domain-containing protein [Oscillatoriales cyanobacterium SM2_3_0]|nr:LamG domain-containing protein [Oscillatoriales cyanobacterium SM2_3_0]